MIRKNISDYFDNYGLLGQRKTNKDRPDFDSFIEKPDDIWIECGDSAQRTGMYLLACFLNPDYSNVNELYKEMMSKHELTGYLIPNKVFGPCGLFRRHPDKRYWYSSPDNFSRDQTRPLVIAMGFYQDIKRLNRLKYKHVRRFGFYQNLQNNWDPNWRDPKKWKRKIPDWLTPECVAEYWRAGGYHFVFYPLLLCFDLFALLGSIADCVETRRRPQNSDYLNKICSSIQSILCFPTPFSILAAYIFWNFTPKRYVEVSDNGEKVWFDDADILGPQSLLDHYFALPDSPPLNDIFRPIISRIKIKLDNLILGAVVRVVIITMLITTGVLIWKSLFIIK